MSTYNQLGISISYKEIKDAVRQRMSIEFTAVPTQVNLDDHVIKDLIKEQKSVSFPPLLNKKEIFRVLWDMPTNNDSEIWDSIVLLAYLSDGQIKYAPFNANSYLVNITF
ncbi:MAG: hypothetical protein ABL857_06620 [Rickettsiales bacterium]